MRAVERAARGGVAGAIVPQHAAVALLDLDRGMVRQQPLHPAVERDPGGGEGVVLARRQRALQALHGLDALRRDRDRELRGFVLDGVKPMRIRPSLLQQPVARAQRAIERIDPAECPASTASTRRSRKRRRSEAGPANSWSIAGVSHTTRR